jgi:hypothetical protein
MWNLVWHDIARSQTPTKMLFRTLQDKILYTLQGWNLCKYVLQSAGSLRVGFPSNFWFTVRSLLLKTDRKSLVLISLSIHHPCTECGNFLGTRLGNVFSVSPRAIQDWYLLCVDIGSFIYGVSRNSGGTASWVSRVWEHISVKTVFWETHDCHTATNELKHVHRDVESVCGRVANY